MHNQQKKKKNTEGFKNFETKTKRQHTEKNRKTQLRDY